VSRPLVEVRAASKTYERGTYTVHALREVTFDVDAGSSLAIMGKSGSGKTTLLNLLSGLDRPTSGDVCIAGTRLADLGVEAATVFRRRNIGFIFQFFNLLPMMSAYDNVALPLLADGVRGRDLDRRVQEVLEAVELREWCDHRPAELSGGMQQRVAVARALVMRPRLLIADEPTGNLDEDFGRDVLRLLREAIERTGCAVVMATHSYEAAGAMDRLLNIRDGRVTEDVLASRVAPRSKPVRLVRPPSGHE
jgi:ABC-type lipoprotein export system ATPase subunit